MFEKAQVVGPAPEIIAHVATGVPTGTSATEYALLHDGMLIRSKTGQDVVLSRDAVQQVLRLAGLAPIPAPAPAAPAPQPETPPEPPRRRYSDRAALSLKEAGSMIGVSAKTLRRAATRGELTLTEVGKQLRVELSEVHAYLRRHRISEKNR